MGTKQRGSGTSPCAHLRAAYHECFNRWYAEKFLKNQWNKDDCVSEWQKYKACLTMKAMGEIPVSCFCHGLIDVLHELTCADGDMQHLEDKNLSRLLEEDAAVYSHIDDPTHMDADSASQ